MSHHIKEQFDTIASFARVPEIGDLIRELGTMMQQRFEHTDSIHTEINGELAKLRDEFQDLARLMFSRLKDTERVNGDKLTSVIDKTHNLANRFMAVETKVNDAVELFDVNFQSIMEMLTRINASGNGNGNDRSEHTADHNQ